MDRKKWDVTRKCLSMQTRTDDDEIQLVIVNECIIFMNLCPKHCPIIDCGYLLSLNIIHLSFLSSSTRKVIHVKKRNHKFDINMTKWHC